MKKTSLTKLKLALKNGEIPWETLLSALSDKECHKIDRKIRKQEREKAKSDKKADDFLLRKLRQLKTVPTPAARPNDDPFGDSSEISSETSSDGTLNRAVDVNIWSTERSMVTIHEQHTVKKVDPFRDEGKDIGPCVLTGNPYSSVSDEMSPADPIPLYSEAVANSMNSKTYQEKLRERKINLRNEKLSEDLDVKEPTQADLKERVRLQNEYKRYRIDLLRRREKIPEPNMINPENGEVDNKWVDWFQNRIDQMEAWLVEDAMNPDLPPSSECDPPRGVKTLLTADWNVFKSSEVKVKWNFEKYGPMILTKEMAYDGKRLYNPINGQTWSNIVEHLEYLVKKTYAKNFENRINYDVFQANDGYFWSHLLQQYYDLVKVSLVNVNVFLLLKLIS